MLVRHKYNQELVSLLSSLVEQYPELRFSQILQVFSFIKTMPDSTGKINWINEFYEEPDEILKRVHVSIQKVSPSKNNTDLTLERLNALMNIRDRLNPITLTALDYIHKKVVLGETLTTPDERYIEEIHRLFLGGPRFERQK